MLQIFFAGVSTRRCEQVLPATARAVGVSKSQVSREEIEAGERLLKNLEERDSSTIDIPAVWIDGSPSHRPHDKIQSASVVAGE
jgi:hypothetical protein